MHTDTQASNAASRPHDWHLYRGKSKCDGVYLRFKGLRQDDISYWTLGSADVLITRSGSCAPSFGWHYGRLSSIRPLGGR